MPRGYRSIVLAGLGCLSLAALPPGQRARGHQQEAATKIADRLGDIDQALKEANEPSDLNKPCAKNQDIRTSQLCAEWRSVDEAKRSGDWARDSFILGIFGSVIGLLTLGAAAFAAWYARKAAIHTEDAATAAHQANRAWLDIGVTLNKRSVIKYVPNSFVFDVTVQYNNIGQSPAMYADIICRTVIDPTSLGDVLNELSLAGSRQVFYPLSIFPSELVATEEVSQAVITPPDNPPFTESFAPLIIVFASYNPNIGAKVRARTVKIYELGILSGDPDMPDPIFVRDCPIERGRISLIERPVYHIVPVT